ncbi:MAG: hypothetical protein KAJ49_05520, partial [Arcobacteraceae bacterium]|nr:hypothetical protein [Arcobacteraceae bacterium]
ENTQEEIVDNGEDSKIEDKEEVGFFAKMLEKVGIGSTKKLPVESEESVTKQELGNEEKLPEVTNKEVAKEEVVEEEPKEEVTDVTNEDTTTKEINTEVTDDTIQ